MKPISLAPSCLGRILAGLSLGINIPAFDLLHIL